MTSDPSSTKNTVFLGGRYIDFFISVVFTFALLNKDAFWNDLVRFLCIKYFLTKLNWNYFSWIIKEFQLKMVKQNISFKNVIYLKLVNLYLLFLLLLSSNYSIFKFSGDFIQAKCKCSLFIFVQWYCFKIFCHRIRSCRNAALLFTHQVMNL